MTAAKSTSNPIRFVPVIVICLGLVAFGMYQTYHKVFDVRKQVVTDYYNQSSPNTATTSAITRQEKVKIIPTVANSGKKINSAILNTSCKIEIKTDEKDYEIATEGLQGVCKNEPFGKISPSGEILVFTGTLGRTASLLKAFIPKYEKTLSISSWKDGDVLDYIILADGELIVLVEILGEWLLEWYDMEQIDLDLAKIYNSTTGYINPGKRRASIKLEFENGKALNFVNGKIQVTSSEKNVLAQIDPMTIILNNRLTTVSPGQAEDMALNLYKQIEKGPGTKPSLDLNGSTDLKWKIAITDTGGRTVKSYLVNNKTGEIE